MEKLEIIKGDIEEQAFVAFDDYLFNLNSDDRLNNLNQHLSLAHRCGREISETDGLIASGIKRAVDAYFPLRRSSN
jgi:hypothetical protein